MTLVYVGIVIGIVGLIIEMGLDYRRRAAELQADQEELREQTVGHLRKANALKERVKATLARVEQLEAEKKALARDLKVQKQLFKETEEEDRKRNPTRFLFKAPSEDA